MQSHSKFLLGDLLLREGLLTQEHVTHACEVQRTLTSPLPYGEVCLRLGFLSPDELAAILKKHHHRIPLGELLVHHGLVSATHVQTALARQRGSTKKLGALLVENGWLSERDLLQELMECEFRRGSPASGGGEAHAARWKPDETVLEYFITAKQVSVFIVSASPA